MKNAARRLLKMVSAIAPLLLAASQFVPFFKTHFITFYKVTFLLFVIFTGFQTSSGSLKPLHALFLQLCSLAAPGFFSLPMNKSLLPELKAGLASALFLWISMSIIPDCLSQRHKEVHLPSFQLHVTCAVLEFISLTVAETLLDLKAYSDLPSYFEFVATYSKVILAPSLKLVTSHWRVWRQLQFIFRVNSKAVHIALAGRWELTFFLPPGLSF